MLFIYQLLAWDRSTNVNILMEARLHDEYQLFLSMLLSIFLLFLWGVNLNTIIFVQCEVADLTHLALPGRNALQ